MDVLARWEAPQVISASFEPRDLNPRHAYTGAPRPGAHEVEYVRADLYRGAVEDRDHYRAALEFAADNPADAHSYAVAALGITTTGGR